MYYFNIAQINTSREKMENRIPCIQSNEKHVTGSILVMFNTSHYQNIHIKMWTQREHINHYEIIYSVNTHYGHYYFNDKSKNQRRQFTTQDDNKDTKSVLGCQ